MNTFTKLVVAVVVSIFGYACAEQVAPDVAPEVEDVLAHVVSKPVDDAPEATSAIVDDAQENQELEKYLQELSAEFDEADSKK